MRRRRLALSESARRAREWQRANVCACWRAAERKHQRLLNPICPGLDGSVKQLTRYLLQGSLVELKVLSFRGGAWLSF